MLEMSQPALQGSNHRLGAIGHMQAHEDYSKLIQLCRKHFQEWSVELQIPRLRSG
jgi:hypothetical protein